MVDEEHVERTLTILPEIHVYSLPPRPSAGGWKCQDWPKTNHIFTGRVRVTAKGANCVIKLEDPTTGGLFAQCPLDVDKPEVSVTTPVAIVIIACHCRWPLNAAAIPLEILPASSLYATSGRARYRQQPLLRSSRRRQQRQARLPWWWLQGAQ